MDKTILVAFIGAGGLILAAVIPVLLQRRSYWHRDARPLGFGRAATNAPGAWR